MLYSGDTGRGKYQEKVNNYLYYVIDNSRLIASPLLTVHTHALKLHRTYPQKVER